MPRYVILLHEMPPASSRPTHWDLMLEWGAALRTWAVEHEPLSADEDVAQQLADHRLAYLEYEGPVSGGRGCVTRWDAGAYHLEGDQDQELVALLHGTRLHHRLILRADAPAAHSWRVSFTAVPTRG